MNRRVALVVVMLLVVAVVPLARAEDLPKYTRYDAMVAMSDGVRLEVSLYRPEPKPAAAIPTLVRQHGGGSNKDNGYDVSYGLKAVESGKFNLLMYSHRGHGASEGLFDFFGERTTKDFSEILDWATANFSEVDDDTFGTWGYSQGGGESLLPAEADSRVKAVAVGNTFDDLNHALNPNDCFKFSFATGIFALAYKSSASKTDDTTAVRWGAQWDTDTEDVPLATLPSTTAEAFAHSPAAHVAPSGTVYDTGLNVPVFWSNSWEDALFPADHGLSILDGLKARGIPTHLWFASGGHEVPGGNDPVDEKGKEQAMLEWFEEFLLGEDHGYASGARPRVDYAQRLPAGGWTHKTATDWPIPDAETLDIALATGTIVNTAASNDVSTEPITFNRSGGAFAGLPDPTDALNAITTTYGPLTVPVESTGAARATINYSTDATRVAQFNVQLWDVSPSGRTLVARGCISDESPGDGKASFDLWPNSHLFSAGHSIQVTVASADVPTFKADTEPQTSTILAGSTLKLTGVVAEI